MADAQVLVKSGDVGPIKRVLSVRERQDLEKTAAVYGYGQIGEGHYLPGSQGAAPVAPPWLNVNRPRLNEQQRHIVKILKEQSAEPIPEGERDKFAKHREKLSAMLKPYLQTRGEIHATKHDDPRFMSCLDKAREWTKPQKDLGGRTPDQIAQDYKNISRRLEPEDELFDSLEKLRSA